jgi:hypothetical protein
MKNYIVLIIIIVLCPVSSWAGSQVVGCCSSTGPIATPQEVSLAAHKATSDVNSHTTMESMAIQNSIETVGETLAIELQKNRTSNESLVEFQTNSIRDLLVQMGSAKEKVEAERTFGPQSRFDVLCAEPEIGGNIQAGEIAEVQVQIRLEDDMKTHNREYRSEKAIRDYITDVPFEKISSESLFPSNKTLKKEGVKDAQNLSQLITNPNPNPELSDADKKTAAGRLYENQRKIKESLLVIPQLVFNKNIAAHSPSVPLGDQAIEMHKSMGGSGDPDEIGIVDGKVSPYAALDLMVNSRFSNPNWYAELGEKNEVAMMRELLAMEAVNLELQRRQLELTQLMALMFAQEASFQIRENLDPNISGQELIEKTGKVRH